MAYIKRLIQDSIQEILLQEKSILLLGPRQTGKTTLLVHELLPDMSYSFLQPELRRRFEANPELLLSEIKGFIRLQDYRGLPIVCIDEIQKVPAIMDVIQLAIDNHLARFVLTGSSARKLKRVKGDLNLLPGRVIELRLDALSLLELTQMPDLEDLLLNGCLPEIILQPDVIHKERLLTSYVGIYLEEEIRAEAIVRNLASFSRFLSYASIEAGKQINMSKLSQEIGVTRHTVNEYYQILEDCLIADRIEAITQVTTRRRLSKAPKYLFFDLGIRRIAAGEGLRLPKKYFSELFEQFVGIEILKLIRIFARQAKLRYWRDHQGPEVDYVIEYNRQFLPIEVKWTDKPGKEDVKHLITFMSEYECVRPAYVVCRTPRPFAITDDILAINWQDLPKVVMKLLLPQ